jgi:hypothetical protein
LGFEKCKISSCGQHRPLASAIPSAHVEFGCRFVPRVSECRHVAGFMDTVEGSDNAKDASVSFVDEAVVDERSIANELATTVNYQVQALDAVRSVDRKGDLVTEAELADVTAHAEAVVNAVRGVTADLRDAVSESRRAFGAMREAKTHRRGAHRQEQRAEAGEAREREARAAADAAHAECATCAALRAQVREIRGERGRLAELAGTWADKARESKDRCASKRESAHAVQLTAEAAKAACVARSTAILERLLAGGP